MTMDMILNASLVPASEVLLQIVEAIVETVNAARHVPIEKESFAKLSTCLEMIIPVLKELSKKNINSSESLKNAIVVLSQEIKVAKQLVLDCSKRNKVYLLVNCRKINKRLEDTTREISQALSPLASLDLSPGITEEITKLQDNMLRAEFKAAVAEENILEKIESGIQERNVDRSYANDLLLLIAEAVGIPAECSALKKEFEDFQKEIEDTKLRKEKDQVETIQMDQIIALLGRADAASSPEEKEIKYFNKRNSLGSQPLEPLQSFYCPITREVMVDPVETSSGQTFERSAIQKWFAEGKTICPLTMTPLDTSILRPNKTLRQSIEEWKNRNTMITIVSLRTKLHSGDEQEVLLSLSQIKELCEEKDLHREWVVMESYIPILIKLLGAKNRDMRNHALVILRILARDNDDNKGKIAHVANAIESIVKSLARRIGESKLAVALLLELSKSEVVCHYIGKVQGCILLLVTMTSQEDIQAARDAKELLENLSFLDQNVIQMARANYFKPLLQRLSLGPENIKIIMATTLAEMELSDHSKLTLFEEGVLGPLLQLITHVDVKTKEVAVKALQNLSTLRQNGLWMIREGAVGPLLNLLYCHSSSFTNLREHVAATIMNLAISTVVEDASQTELSLLESDEDIFRLFSLINLTGPDVQWSILRTFHAMCQPQSATDLRSKLRQCSAVQLLVQLCELDNATVRANAVKLFCCLTVDGDDGMLLEHVDQRCVETLLRIIRTSNDNEEIAAAIGIVANLPKDQTQITHWLLDAGAPMVIFRFLSDRNYTGSGRNHLIENATGAICRFTVTMNQEWQKRAAEAGIIPVLVQLLDSGTALAKRYAAISLAQFSESSVKLSRQIKKHGGLWCWSPPPETTCPVHMGICSVESSFCLLEAGAVQPLVGVLGEPDIGACEAALEALLTLIDGERLQSGTKALAEANAIAAIIKLLGSPSIQLQKKSLYALERIFRLGEFKQKYGASAQMPLVDITQRGNSATKSLAAKILAQLNVLHDQSSYF